MKAVIDANYIFGRDIPSIEISKGFITQAVRNEIKDKASNEYYDFYSFQIEIRDPQEKYVQMVRDEIKNKHYGVSSADISVIALTLELNDEISNEWLGPDNTQDAEEVVCLSKDNGIKSALGLFGLNDDPEFENKTYKLRCFTCYKVYDTHVDFCKRCGYGTITRVSVLGEGENERILLKKNFRMKPKILKDFRGVEIKSEDQREYSIYQKEKRKREKNAEKIDWNTL
ncbi:hypothetical protein ENBRE01_1339 [Enteropsectra breve]|nr:hypothetical protein ENBRE01_1339 [Enteropsectra breve]